MNSVVYSPETLEQVRKLIAEVKEQDLTDYAVDRPLDLDSTNRIAMIVELENHFGIVMSEDDVMPEMFESLASLAAAVEVKRV